uniref:Uncharacterized protein n=1 Tax=Ciona savignyi TaxID=51511 RepID=H2YG94_CIOSA
HCKWKQLAKIFYFAITCCAVVVYYFYNSNLKPLLYERYSKPLSKLELQSNKDLFGSKEWRQYYSEINELLSGIENGQVQWPVPVTNLTSPLASHVVVQTRLEYVVGEKLVAKVVAKDSFGNRKKYGGDYFYARLLSDRSQGSEVMEGITCDVVDHGDGSYTISAPLLFPGQSALHVDLVHPSDAVVALILETTGSSGSGINFISTYPSKENVKCNVGLPGLSPSQVCNFSQPRKGFVWFCAAPQSPPCPSYVLYTHTE